MASQNGEDTLVSDDLTCPVCLSIFRDPVTLMCGHSFCRSCARILETSADRTCAICRSTFSTRNLPTNFTLRNIIAKEYPEIHQSPRDIPPINDAPAGHQLDHLRKALGFNDLNAFKQFLQRGPASPLIGLPIDDMGGLVLGDPLNKEFPKVPAAALKQLLETYENRATGAWLFLEMASPTLPQRGILATVIGVDPLVRGCSLQMIPHLFVVYRSRITEASLLVGGRTEPNLSLYSYEGVRVWTIPVMSFMDVSPSILKDIRTTYAESMRAAEKQLGKVDYDTTSVYPIGHFQRSAINTLLFSHRRAILSGANTILLVLVLRTLTMPHLAMSFRD